MKKIWKKIVEFIKKLFSGDIPIIKKIPNWDECTKSSNWHGANASQRMMNILSPKCSDDTFKAYLSWMKSRGCNCCHLILANKADGQFAKYSIYGEKFDFNINKDYANVMLARVKKISEEGMGVVLWMITDDSADWAKTLIKNPDQYVKDLDDLGFFKYASTVVMALEANEYWSREEGRPAPEPVLRSSGECSKFYAAIKKKYSGKVGVHQTSGKYDYAGVADIFFGQLNPGSSKSQIQTFVKTCLNTGKPVNMFELERQEDRTRSQYALDAGAYGVGNW